MWVLAHGFKRLFPEARDALTESVGEGRAKGVIAIVLLVAIALMLAGYLMTDYEPVYTPPSWGAYVTGILMLAAFALFGMSQSGGTCRAWFRHPMLMGVATWGVAHLLSNGDMASVILFGGLALWAAMEMILINTREPEWERPEPGTHVGDLKLAGLTVLVFAVISGLHWLIGPSPFPG